VRVRAHLTLRKPSFQRLARPLNRCLSRTPQRLPPRVPSNQQHLKNLGDQKKIHQTYLRPQPYHQSHLPAFRSTRSQNIQRHQNRSRAQRRRPRQSPKQLSAKFLITCARRIKPHPRQLHTFVIRRRQHRHRSRKLARHRHHRRRGGWVRTGVKSKNEGATRAASGCSHTLGHG
jgi:hypothetical protein